MGNFKVLALLACIGLSLGAPTKFTRNSDLKDVFAYLERFGYVSADDLPIEGNADDPPTEENLEGPLRLFQEKNGLPVTGQLDDATLKLMNTPRCGVRDVMPEQRYDAVVKWNKSPVSYRINNEASTLAVGESKAVIGICFLLWSLVCNIKFTETAGGADIEMKFGSGNHGDPYPFDGPWGVLAHAYYPQNGDTHFDNSENWTVQSYSGVNLVQVAIHEIGHAIGLGHSSYSDAIMYAYHTNNPDFKFHSDDIAGAQALYGLPA